MARWEPDAKGRLERAAMELFDTRGYASTTVADIAAHAGLTERTFFRYFTDKREVLFSGSQALEALIVDAVKQAPAERSPFDVVTDAFMAAGAHLQQQRELTYVRQRWAIVTEHAEVQERELIKMASLAAAVTRALHERGVSEPAASLTAEAGVTIFKVGFQRWVTAKAGSRTELTMHLREATDGLRTLTAPVSPPRPRARRG